MGSNREGSNKSKVAEAQKSCVNVLVAVLSLLSKCEHESSEIHALAETLLLMERTGELEKFIKYYESYLRSL